MSWAIVGGMVVILVGVALVRWKRVPVIPTKTGVLSETDTVGFSSNGASKRAAERVDVQITE